MTGRPRRPRCDRIDARPRNACSGDRNVEMTDRRVRIDQLVESAERYDTFAETAELMGDEPSAERFREMATTRRLAAMELLDD